MSFGGSIQILEFFWRINSNFYIDGNLNYCSMKANKKQEGRQ
jgi:hypothetical protein